MRRTFGFTALALVFAARAWGDGVFLVNTGDPDGKMAMASRPSSAGAIEIEAADDFLLSCPTTIERASFIGLLPLGQSSVSQVVIEIYRVFPADSDTSRTITVPTRVNSPSDVAFTSRDSAASQLTFGTSVLSTSFTALNSVLNGIHPVPNETTGGDGPVTGQEVEFDVTFTSTISLPAGHYFFIPQVALDTGDFFWLSAPRPIVSPGAPFSPDLQAWIRNQDLSPDWLRVGTDIVGGSPAPTFNGTFSLGGTTAPFPVTASTASPLVAVLGQAIAPVTFSASGGTAPYTFAETGPLPGLSLDASTGVLSGIPNATGSFPFSVTATDALGCTGSVAFTIEVGTSAGIPTLGAAGIALLFLAVGAAGFVALRR